MVAADLLGSLQAAAHQVGAEVQQPDLGVRHVGDRVDRVQDRVLHRGVNKISRNLANLPLIKVTRS